MITCPKCGELNGDNRDTCFNCFAKLTNKPISSTPTSNTSTKNITDMLITKGDTINNYSIKRYLGIVNGAHPYNYTGLLNTFIKDEIMIDTIYELAEQVMLKKAKQKGANAIINLETSFITPGATNMILVCVQGTAVYIEKNKE